VPILLGSGERLLEDVGDPKLEPVKVGCLTGGDTRQVPDREEGVLTPV
jgi:hypothetical protein